MKKQLVEDLETALKGILYCESALSSNLENWERKEFQAVLKSTKDDAESLKQRIKFI